MDESSSVILPLSSTFDYVFSDSVPKILTIHNRELLSSQPTAYIKRVNQYTLLTQCIYALYGSQNNNGIFLLNRSMF